MKFFIIWVSYSFFTQMGCWYWFLRMSFDCEPLFYKLDEAEENMRRFFRTRDYWKLAAENPNKRIYQEIIEERAYYDKQTKVEKEKETISIELGKYDVALAFFHIFWFFLPFVFYVWFSFDSGISFVSCLMYIVLTIVVNLLAYGITRWLFSIGMFECDFENDASWHRNSVRKVVEKSEKFLKEDFEYIDEDYLNNISWPYNTRWNYVNTTKKAKSQKPLIILIYPFCMAIAVIAPISLVLLIANIIVYFIKKKKRKGTTGH